MFGKLFDPTYKEFKKCSKVAEAVVALEDEYKKLTDEELKAKTPEFKKRLEKGETLDDIMVEAFATAREAASRVLGLTPFKVQIIGAAAMHFGNIAEMKTGEGKTLTSVLVAYLNALPGKGVHIVTVNEYLASRDATEMGEVHKFLGLTVGLNLRELDSEQKREQYYCDITYSTNSELGFDYLRDHMVLYKEQMVQRPEMNFAIVDEVDSILIDEARTPLIISGGEKKGPNLYVQANSFAKCLHQEDYEIDVKDRHVALTESGMSKAEKYFNVDNLYDVKNVTIVHHINNALRANYIMEKDKDYVVHEGAIVIVDPFTGRLMVGRQWSDGLHQAIEAKENVQIKKETRTLATITYQNYFRMYKKLAGMTGTAKTEEEEFRNIYNMFVVEIPTNVPVIRIDEPDLIFRSMKAKYLAIAKDIKERHEKGQPVLVGTISIESSELLSNLLKRNGIPHSVLNAKQHEREAEIIAKAGQKGSVTIATNMAGRGTDIKLGEGVKELGGLCVIGSERHESRRIDNQLRGRSGRQGDPGFTQFFVSFEDDLLVRFGSDRYKDMLKNLGFTGDMAIQNKMFSKTVESAQRKVEGNNFDIRKQLLNYDDVMNNQREIIYGKRNEILDNDSIHETVLNGFKEYISDIVNSHLVESNKLKENDYSEILEAVNENLLRKYRINLSEINGKHPSEVIDLIYENALKDYEEKLEDIPEEVRDEFEKAISLRVIDNYWMEHISTMSHLRDGIGLRGYANTSPLQAYTMEGYQLFDEMIAKINRDISIYLLKSEIRQNIERKQVAKTAITNDSKDHAKVQKKSTKVGRNDPCPCGSGKKYKNCCGK